MEATLVKSRESLAEAKLMREEIEAVGDPELEAELDETVQSIQVQSPRFIGFGIVPRRHALVK